MWLTTDRLRSLSRQDFHDSGGDIAAIWYDLPPEGTEYLIRYGNCYFSCETKLMLGGVQVNRIAACGSGVVCTQEQTGS